MKVQFRIDPRGLQGAMGLLRRGILKLTGGLDGMMTEVAQVMYLDVKKRFETKTTPDGAAWAANRPWKTRGSILELDGNLVGSIQKANTAFEARVYPDTGLPYAAVQNFGGIVGRGVQLPARTYMGISVEAQMKIKIISDKKAKGIFV